MPCVQEGCACEGSQYRETYCTSCGAIVDEEVSYSLPMHELGSPSHEPASLLIPGKGFADERVDGLPGVGKHLESRPLDPVERNFLEAFFYFSSVSHNLSMPYDAKVFMAWLYRKCARYHITKGRYLASVVLATAKEERVLIKRFKRKYMKYRKSVPRWI